MYKTSSEDLSIEEALDFIKLHKGRHARYQRLKRYYEGHHDILDIGGALQKRDNKIMAPYPKYITDFSTGFFMGNPVRYNATREGYSEDDEFLEEYTAICKANNEAKENLTLARTNSIKGESYEVLWIGWDGKVHFKQVEPDNAFIIHDATINEEEKFGIRYYYDQQIDKGKPLVTYIEIYDSDRIRYYSNEDDSDHYALVDEKPHPFQGVPLIRYKNNEECQGDFEQVISLIDAYNREQSNTLNDMDEFSDAYLALVNYSASTKEDINEMKQSKILLLDDDGDAKWVTKDVNDTWVENYKKRLNKDIHKFSFTPDFTDEAFGTNLPGVSLRLKLLTSEELRGTKELYFRDGLIKRMDLIGNFLQVTNDRDIIRDEIQIVFSDVLPQNIHELAQIVTMLSQDVSTETRLSLLPFIENPTDELAKKESEEQQRTESDMILYKNLAGESNGEREQ